MINVEMDLMRSPVPNGSRTFVPWIPDVLSLEIQKFIRYDEKSCPQQKVKNIRSLIVELDKQIEQNIRKNEIEIKQTS